MRIDYPRTERRGLLHWLPSWRQLLTLFLLGVGVVVVAFVVLYERVQIPSPNDFGSVQRNVVMYSDNKTEIGWQGQYNRQMVPFDQIPQTTRYAVLAAEDRSFYEHGAISPIGLARAIVNNVSGGSTQGGSTITQQYVKNYYLTQNRTLQRKIRELFISMKIEKRLSKDEILGNYLNTIYFGRSSYGVETAARAYFGTDVQKLDLAQSAALAAMIRAPGLYDPTLGGGNVERFRGRFQYVLDGMLEKGWITQAQHDQTTPPKIKPPADTNRFAGPNGYLMQAAIQGLSALGFTRDQIDQGGLRVVTTIDAKAQKAAAEAVSQSMPTKDAKGVHAGMAAVRPGTGEIVAMYGGADYVKNQFNVATDARKPGGSTFKPFALAAALENGIGLKTTYDAPGVLKNPPGYSQPVANEGNVGYGRINLIKATALSVNTVYVQLGADVGPAKIYDSLARAGIPKNAPGMGPYPSIVLGPASVSPLQMADAYATLAASGKQVQPYLIKEVLDADGASLYRASPQPKQVYETRVVDDVTYALQQVVKNGTGTRAQALGRPAAGKTGTAENNGKIVSTWFAGYTPQLAAAALVYRESSQGQPQDLRGLGGYSDAIGGRYPAMIWTAFMKAALAGEKVEDFPPPAWIGGTPTPTVTATPTPTPSATVTVPASPTPSQPPTPTPTGTSSGQPGFPLPSVPGGSWSPSPTATPTTRSTNQPGRASTPTPTPTATGTKTPR